MIGLANELAATTAARVGTMDTVGPAEPSAMPILPAMLGRIAGTGPRLPKASSSDPGVPARARMSGGGPALPSRSGDDQLRAAAAAAAAGTDSSGLAASRCRSARARKPRFRFKSLLAGSLPRGLEERRP